MSHYLRMLGVLLLLQFPAWGADSEKQHQRTLSKFSIGISGGLTQFFGELNEQDFKGVLKFDLNHHLDDRWMVSLNLLKGQLGGLERQQFQSVFESRFHQIDLLVKYNILKKKKTWEPDKPFQFGFLTGLGLMRFHSEAYDAITGDLIRFTNSPNSARNPLFQRWGTPKGNKRGIKFTNERAIPVGFWLNVPLTNHIGAGVECRFYFVRTDKLDATSGSLMVNPEEANSYSNTPNDKYSFVAVNLAYRFSKNSNSDKTRKSRK